MIPLPLLIFGPPLVVAVVAAIYLVGRKSGKTIGFEETMALLGEEAPTYFTDAARDPRPLPPPSREIMHPSMQMTKRSVMRSALWDMYMAGRKS